MLVFLFGQDSTRGNTDDRTRLTPVNLKAAGFSRLHLTTAAQRPHRSGRCETCHGVIHQRYMPALYMCKIVPSICYQTQMPVISEWAVWVGVLERCCKPSKERLSVFLENVRQEMPKAHLELLHSGSLCVTVEAFGARLCLPA